MRRLFFCGLFAFAHADKSWFAVWIPRASVLLLLILHSYAYAEEMTEVPLDHIWELNIPGTIDIRELEPKFPKGLSNAELTRRSQVFRLLRSLNRIGGAFHRERQMGPGFTVVGTGADALNQAHRVLVEKEVRIESFPEGSPVSIVFYTGLSSRYVRLDIIRRTGNDIVINYHLVSHSSMELTTHCALIPLGVLPKGRYRASFLRGPPTTADSLASEKALSAGQVRRIVCDSYSFIVE